MGRLVAVGLLALLATGLGGCGGGSGDVGLGFAYPEFPSFPSKAPIRVPQEVATINEAVHTASSGDTILVSPGVYKETVTVGNSDLQIVGTDRDTVILEALGSDTGAITLISGVKNVRIATMTIRPDPSTPTEPLAEVAQPTSSPAAAREGLAARAWPIVDVSAVAFSQSLGSLPDFTHGTWYGRTMKSLINTAMRADSAEGDLDYASSEGIWLENLTVGTLRDDAAYGSMGASLMGMSGTVVRDCSFLGLKVGLWMSKSSGVVGDCSFRTKNIGVLVEDAPQQVTLNQNQVSLLPQIITSPEPSSSGSQNGVYVLSSPVRLIGNTVEVEGTQAITMSGISCSDCPEVTLCDNRINCSWDGVAPAQIQQCFVTGISCDDSPEVTLCDNQIKCSSEFLSGFSYLCGLTTFRCGRLAVGGNKVEVLGNRFSRIEGVTLHQCGTGSVHDNDVVTDCDYGIDHLESIANQACVILSASNLSFFDNRLQGGRYSRDLHLYDCAGDVSQNVFNVAASSYGVVLTRSGGSVVGNRFLAEDPCLCAIYAKSESENAYSQELEVRGNFVRFSAGGGMAFSGNALSVSCHDNQISVKSFSLQDDPANACMGLYFAGCCGEAVDNQISIATDVEGSCAIFCSDSLICLRGNVIEAEGHCPCGIALDVGSGGHDGRDAHVSGNTIIGGAETGILIWGGGGQEIEITSNNVTAESQGISCVRGGRVAFTDNIVSAGEYGIVCGAAQDVQCSGNIVSIVPSDPAASTCAVALIDVGKASVCRNRVSALGAFSAALEQYGSTMEATNNLLSSEYAAVALCSGADGSAPLSFIRNNVIVGKVGGIVVYDQAAHAGLQVFSNIVRASYGVSSAVPINADYNDILADIPYDGISAGPHDLAVDPQFVDTVDYRLQSWSPCIDAGIEDPAYNDLIPPGQATVRNDMGAYGGPLAGTIPAAPPAALRQDREAGTNQARQGAATLPLTLSRPDRTAEIQALRQDLERELQQHRATRQRLDSERRSALRSSLEAGARRAGGAL